MKFKFSRKNQEHQEPMYHFEFGSGELKSFIVDFYFQEDEPQKCYLEISTISGIFNLKLQGIAYGYLLESARQGKEENIHGFCAMMYLITDRVFSDEGFADDLIRACNKYQNRMFKKATELAKKATKKDEDASKIIMDSVIERANMNKRQSKKASKIERELAKDVIDEIYNKNNHV